MLRRYLRLVGHVLRSPGAFLSLASGVLRGTYYICRFRMFRKNTVIRFPFICHARVDINGPGRVFIDRECSVWLNTLEHLVIETLHPDAEVRIGRGCTLAGLTIRCRGRVVIGEKVLFAANLVQDVFLASHPEVSLPGKEEQVVQEIWIGDHVWLGGQSMILEGTAIGNTSVIGVNAVLRHTAIEGGCLVSGNPAMRPVSIERILRLRDKTE